MRLGMIAFFENSVGTDVTLLFQSLSLIQHSDIRFLVWAALATFR